MIAKLGLSLSEELAKHFDLIGKYYLNVTENSAHLVNEFYESLKSQTEEMMKTFYLINPYQLNEKNLTIQVNIKKYSLRYLNE